MERNTWGQLGPHGKTESEPRRPFGFVACPALAGSGDLGQRPARTLSTRTLAAQVAQAAHASEMKAVQTLGSAKSSSRLGATPTKHLDTA